MKSRGDTMDLNRLKTAFPEFNVDTLPSIPEGWVDVSWHNDACPCFSPSVDSEISVFVDYEKFKDRESEAEKRFSVHEWKNGSNFESDSWEEILEHVKKLVDIESSI
jgi:hypothetical protein